MEELNYKKVGEKLKNLRKYFDLTQEQVASILNIGRDAIIRIEKGERKIDIDELNKFSKLYFISVDELIQGTNNVENDSIAFARGFSKLSDKDKKEILSLIEFKNNIKSKK